MENRKSLILNVLRSWRFNYISRRQLLALDNQALKDIGLSRADALEEGRKPFWKGADTAVQITDISDAGSNDMIIKNSHRTPY